MDIKTKVTRENCCKHLVEYELNMVGKSLLSTIDDMEWYSNITMTRDQHEKFKLYSIRLIKKIYKVNTTKASEIFDWFNLSFGLRIKN